MSVFTLILLIIAICSFIISLTAVILTRIYPTYIDYYRSTRGNRAHDEIE